MNESWLYLHENEAYEEYKKMAIFYFDERHLYAKLQGILCCG